jgi:ABC-type lipoprotein export system ATPase subunit
MRVAAGEFLAVAGPSSSDKTTRLTSSAVRALKERLRLV